MWREHDASWFVLCGYYTPPVLTFGVEANIVRHEHGPEIGTITLTVEPWLPVETVAEMYRDAQRQMVGKKPRRVSGKMLYLLEVVEMLGEDMSWRERMDLWNDLHIGDLEAQYTDHRNFRRAYQRAHSLVLEPGYVAGQQDEEAAREQRRRQIQQHLSNAERQVTFIHKASGET